MSGSGLGNEQFPSPEPFFLSEALVCDAINQVRRREIRRWMLSPVSLRKALSFNEFGECQRVDKLRLSDVAPWP